MDSTYLRRALRLAARGRYRVSPNPMVGALVVADGTVVGRGYQRELGGPHAEVAALREAGDRARGGTLYVTLEPCNHHGRTPPCVEAVIAAGVRRVVVSHRDPNPRVTGGGLERLREAGTEIDLGQMAAEAIRLNVSYLTAMTLGRPAVTLKWAMSLDGRIATSRGESQWISSDDGRRWALALREEHDAILVGSGTVLADDPRLTRRLGWAGRPNLRIVLDRRLRVPVEARLWSEEGEVLVYTESADRQKAAHLEERGASVVRLPRVEPDAVLEDLGPRGVQSLLVEGGAEILGAFVEAEAFDRAAVCCAPLLIGGTKAPGPVGGEGAKRLAEAIRLEELEVGRRGIDLVVTGARRGCMEALRRSVESR